MEWGRDGTDDLAPKVLVSPHGFPKVARQVNPAAVDSAWRHIEPGSRIDTDTWSGYNLLGNAYDHRSVKHSEEYVTEEGVHCNTAEAESSVRSSCSVFVLLAVACSMIVVQLFTEERKMFDDSGVGDRLAGEEAYMGDKGYQGIQHDCRAVLRGPKPKVIRVIARLNIGGPAIHTSLLTAGLEEEGFETLLVTGIPGQHEGDMSYLAQEMEIEPIVIPELRRNINPKDALIALFKLYRLLRRERPQVVHTHTTTAGLLGRLAAKLVGVPVILHTFHGHVLRGYFSPTVSKALTWIERFLALLSDKIVTVSEGQRRELAELGVAPLGKIIVVHLGFELEDILTCESHRGELRHELGISNDDRLIGIVARLTSIKNHRLFLQMAKLVAEAMPQTRFLVVGDGELREELEAYARDLGLDERVIFTGWWRDLPRLYADLDVMTLTSINEGTPTSLIEAMAARVPVVATEVGGVPDIVADGKTGYLVRPGDAQGMAEAVIELLRNPKRAQEMGQKGQEAAYPKFAAQTLIANVKELYIELLRQKGLYTLQ
ncbi:MAG: glycosyltransferase [Chloroflexota bacterium]|nr:glycosyltransferase [Chloroflexota bacterium]